MAEDDYGAVSALPTSAASSDDLALLEADARRRGVSLAHVLRELVAREAADLRRTRRPRVGIACTAEGAAHVATKDEHAPVRDHAGT